MIEVSKKELKKTSRKFRTLASRVINAHYEEVNSIIKMFMDYVDSTPIISGYIESILIKADNLQDELVSINQSYGRKILSTGSNPEEEVSTVYQVLKYISENPSFPIYSLGWGYTSSNKYQDMVKAFGDRIVLPFVNQIDEYLMDIATDMGYDEENKFMINVNGGQAQVNIANDSGTINATQNNEYNNQELKEILDKIHESINNEVQDNAITTVLNQNLSVIQEELKNPNSKKNILSTAFNTLKTLAGGIPKVVTLAENISKLEEILKPLIG